MKQLLLVALGVASLSACKKDNDATPTAPTRTTLLTPRNWRITALSTTTTATGGTPTTVDAYAQMPACQKDDFRRFNINNTLVIDESTTKCTTTAPQQTSARWDFNSTQTQLRITGPGTTPAVIYDVLELTATTLRLRQTSQATAGTTTTTTVATTTFTAF